MIDGKHLESEVEIMTAEADTGHGNSPERSPTELDAAAAHTPRPAAEATTAPADTTVSGMPDADSPTQAAEGQGTTPHLPPGATVRYFGDYELQREIARGGMGVVFKARQVKLNRPVALKMILAGSLAGEAEIQRFYLEAEAAANLDHPGIVPIFEVGNHEGQHYFSMGFVEGQSLAQRVAEGPLPPREAAGLMVQIAEAVQYAHEKEVIHRDLKPSNVLLDAQGQPKVTDFGLAKKLRSDSALTASGQIMGTPSYMPPEQAEARADIGPLADVYSLGAILFCLLTGRPPFQAASAWDTLKQVLEQDPPAPHSLNAAIPLDLETIALKCLQKEPHRRYGSARELAEELNRFLADKPIRARQVSSTERCGRWARRNPVVAVMCGVLTALLVAVAVGSLLVAGRFASLAGAEHSARLESDRLASSESEARVEAEKAHTAESKEKLRAEEALRDAVDQTYLATRNEVRAIRLAHESGWRRAALERIGGLVGLGSRKLDRADLRTEAIACLAELDVRLESNFAPDNDSFGAWHLQFSPDGRTLAVNDDKKSRIYLRDLTSDRELPSITKSVGLAPFVFHPGGAVAVPSAPGRVTFHALKPGQRTFPAIAGEGHALNLAFSQSGERLAIAWGDVDLGNLGAPTRLHRITVHETATGSTLRTIAAPPNIGVTYKLPLALSPDGNLVAVAGPDVSIRLYPVVGDGEPAILSTLDARNCALAFRPDGRALAACGGAIVVLWDLPSRAQLLRIVNGKGLWGIAFSPDGRLLAAASNDATGRLWDVRSGRELAAVPTQTGGMGLSVAFSPQGDRFAVGAVSVSVLAIEGGRECRTEISQTNMTYDSVFDPIQPVLFGCGGDRKVYAWSLDQSVAEVNHVWRVGELCPLRHSALTRWGASSSLEFNLSAIRRQAKDHSDPNMASRRPHRRTPPDGTKGRHLRDRYRPHWPPRCRRIQRRRALCLGFQGRHAPVSPGSGCLGHDS